MAWALFDTAGSVNEFGFDFARETLHGRRIVVADDNGSILKWLKFSLEDYKVNVHTFQHGQETIDFLQNEQNNGRKVDVVILDLIMNRLGGLEIAKQIAGLKSCHCLIFITGCSEDSKEYLEAQKLAIVLQKPVGVEKILRVILEFLDKNLDKRFDQYVVEHNVAS